MNDKNLNDDYDIFTEKEVAILKEIFEILETEENENIKLDSNDYEESDKFKQRMNRLFREQAGGDHALHPEVDNAYERIRSRIVRFFLVIRYRISTLFKKV